MTDRTATLALRTARLILLLAAFGGTCATAQQTAPPPERGGFSLENLGRPADPPRQQPQVQGPVDPEAPIATRPAPRQTPTVRAPSPDELSRAGPARLPTALVLPEQDRQAARGADPSRSVQPRAAQARSASPPPVSPNAPSALAGSGGVAPLAADAARAPRDPLGATPIVRSVAEGGGMAWAWLLALVAVVAGAIYVLRSRNRAWAPTVGVPLAEAPAKPQATPAPRRSAALPGAEVKPPVPPPAAPETPPPAVASLPAARAGEGLEIVFLPDYAAATLTRVAMRYAMIVRNTGSRAVRDIAIRTAMIPASAQQDSDVADFFAAGQDPAAHRVASLGAGQSIELEGELALPLGQTRPLRYGQRLLFVPLAAFALHFTRNGRPRALDLAYMVGVGSGSDGKMGPLRLDLGPKTYNQVAQRPLAFASGG